MSDSLKNTTISVIIPTYNRSQTIARSLESVINQTVSPDEIIVIDDCSSDGTEEVVKKYKQIKYIRLSRNIGAGAARNYGVKIAKGEYIAFQDSDDVWCKRRLEEQINYLSSHPGVDIVCTSIEVFRNNDESKIYHPVKSDDSWSISDFRNYVFGTSTWLIRKNLFLIAGGFDSQLPNTEDFEFLARVHHSAGIAVVPKVLVKKYVLKDGIDCNKDSLRIAIEYLENKYRKDWKRSPRGLEELYFRLSLMNFRSGEMAIGRRVLRKSLKMNSFKLKIWFWLFVSFFGQRMFIKIFYLRQSQVLKKQKSLKQNMVKL